MKTSHLIAILGACILNAHSPQARASDLVTYQGKLTDAASAPLPDGQYRIGVRIWDVTTGGAAPLWARKYDVPVASGTFSLMIGASGLPWDAPAPLTSSLKLALAGTSRFVEITVMSDAGQAEKPAVEWQVLAPRQALGSVPYALNGVPPGTVVPFAGTVIPDGWLLCDGTQYATDDRRFAALFATIQTSFGSGTGTFRVPDLRGRAAIGAGQGSGLSNRLLAQTMGAETHLLTAAEMPSHSHSGRTNTDGAHSHTTSGNAADDDGGTADTHFALGDSNAGRGWIGIGIGGGAHFHDFTTNATGGNQPHNNMQPSIILNYIIKF